MSIPATDNSLTRQERILYHQIHPAKIAADVSGSLISIVLIWQHHFWWAMLGAFVPVIIGSALVLNFSDLAALKNSRLGRYVQWYMTRWIEAWRSGGQIVAWVDAWYHLWSVVIIGYLLVVVAWCFGLCLPVTRSNAPRAESESL